VVVGGRVNEVMVWKTRSTKTGQGRVSLRDFLFRWSTKAPSHKEEQDDHITKNYREVQTHKHKINGSFFTEQRIRWKDRAPEVSR